jgi:hypothetical protein
MVPKCFPLKASARNTGEAVLALDSPSGEPAHPISSHLAVVGNLDKWHCRNSAKTGFRQLQPVGSELFDKGVGKLVAKPTTRSSERRQQELSRWAYCSAGTASSRPSNRYMVDAVLTDVENFFLGCHETTSNRAPLYFRDHYYARTPPHTNCCARAL